MLRQIQKLTSLFLVLFLSRGLAQAKPRLFVVIVVDQLRSDIYERHRPEFKSGLKDISDNGTVATKARYSHVPTVTATGHATIVTGLPPGRHGVIGNAWYDRTQKKLIRATDSKAPTVGDLLKKLHPLSRVVSVSLKKQSAQFLGGQSSDSALWFDTAKNIFTTFDTHDSPARLMDFNASLPISAKGEAFLLSDEADKILTDLCLQEMAEGKLGQDDHPDLLLISFSTLDLLGHHYGPDDPRIPRHLGRLDQYVGRLLAEIRRASGGNFVLVLTSDHGVLPLPESPAGKKMGAQRVDLRGFKFEMNKAINQRLKIYRADWVLSFKEPDVYLNLDQAQKAGLSTEKFLKEVAAALQTVRGVARVFIPGDWSGDPYGAIYERSYFSGRSGDLQVRLNPGFYVTDWKTGTGHGSPYDYDALVPWISYGKGIPRKSVKDIVSVENIAPLIAQQLEIPWPKP